MRLAERVSRDANVVQVYGAALAADRQSVLLVMELMRVRAVGFLIPKAYFLSQTHVGCWKRQGRWPVSAVGKAAMRLGSHAAWL